MTDHNPADPYPTSPYPTSPYPAHPPQPQAYPQQAPTGYYPGPPPQPFGPPEPKKSRLWLWLTLTAAILVLCCGGGTVAGLVLYSTSADAPVALPTGTKSPSASPPSFTSSAKLAVPATLAGYPKFSDPSITPLLDSLKGQLEGLPGGNVDGVVSGVYGDPSNQQLRLFVAAKADIPNPNAVTSGMLTGFKASGAKTSNFADVPPGPLGGAAQCGDVEQKGVEMALCIWADDETFGMVFFYFVKASTVESTFVQARGEIETRA